MLIAVGFCLYAANQASEISAYGKAGLFGGIFAGSITAISLALYSIRAMGLLYLTRPIALVTAAVILISGNPPIVNIGLISIALAHVPFFSERLISKTCRDIGSKNEDCFILKTPLSITLWFAFTWFVVWASFIEAIHLFLEERTILGVISFFVGMAIFSLFVAAQTRTLYRRCVIVPNGIVASDPIAFTDVMLFPLSKIKSISSVQYIGDEIRNNDSFFIATNTKKNVVSIALNEKTDSLIARNAVGESTRKNVEQIFMPFAEPKLFVQTFHSRFHKVQAQPLTRSQEKMLEKQLGIETAPRSDAPLPKWRKGKTSK